MSDKKNDLPNLTSEETEEVSGGARKPHPHAKKIHDRLTGHGKKGHHGKKPKPPAGGAPGGTPGKAPA